jgi:rSAM/selenodomain-associated transferase 2
MDISIIVPALNEAPNLADTLATTQCDSTTEVILVDGGSEDDTVAIAQSFGAQIVMTQAGRARQMNAGAAVASGEILLFLHADTKLPKGFDRHIHHALAEAGAIAGAFRLGLEGAQRGLRFIEMMANWRSLRWQLPYGDQAIFLRAKTFIHAGGFPYIPLMEDFEMIRRLRRQGRIVIAPVPVVSSARRWLKLGVLKTTMINQAVIAAYLCGISSEHIADWYNRDPGVAVDRGERRQKPAEQKDEGFNLTML